MSIYKQNIDPIALTEVDADAFLESVGVELYKDSIAIDGTLYEGAYGEEVLAENGIFLYEDGIVLEGKQAEEYKARKAKEKEDRDRERVIGSTRELNKYASRKTNPQHDESYRFATDAIGKRKKEFFDAVEKMGNYSDLTKNRRDNISRNRNSELTSDAIDKGKHYTNAMHKNHIIADTYGRHMRRHPKQYAKPKNESTIFSDIEII